MCAYSVSKSCLTPCGPIGCSPPGSSVHGISQAGILEWVTISFSRGSSQPWDQTHVSWNGRWILLPHTHTHTHTCVKVKSLSCVQFIVTPWTVAYQAPPSMGFFRKEYWSGLPFPSPEDLPNLHLHKTLIYIHLFMFTYLYYLPIIMCIFVKLNMDSYQCLILISQDSFYLLAVGYL